MTALSDGEGAPMTQVLKLEGEVRRLGNKREFRKTGEGDKAEKGLAPFCKTCTRSSHGTHGRMAYPGRKVRCYDCGFMGHCTGTKAKLAKDNVKQASEDVNGAAGTHLRAEWWMCC